MYLIRILLFMLLLRIFFCVAAYGQVKKIEVIGDPITCKDHLFVSDVHYHNGDLSFIGAMSLYAQEQFGISNVATEMGRSLAYLINRYIKDGDPAIFFYKMNSKNVAVLDKWRAVNLSLPKDKQITIFGVDFERMEFAKALQLIFKEHGEAAGTELYRYVHSFPDSVCRYSSILVEEQRSFRKEAYAHARELFEKEKDILTPMLHADFDIVEQILENPVTEKHFGKRDKDMPVSLLQQLHYDRFICFLGGEHTNIYRPFSAINKYMLKSNNNVTIITEVCKNYPDKAYKSSDVTAQPDYMTLGPKDIRTNDSVLALAFGKYHKTGYFSLINQLEFKGLIKKNNRGIPTYYVFSDLLNE